MSSVSELLKELAGRQSSGHKFYPDGIFPSQRYHPLLPYLREDDNLFFSATIAFTLQAHRSLMTDDERVIADEIVQSVVNSLPKFRNKVGKSTYNFWQTDPSRHFPNGIFMRKLEHFRIPDDADDSVLAHMIHQHKPEEEEELKQLLVAHANWNKKPIRNTWQEFLELKAPSTFFGEKMRIEFDAVVMSNVLLFLMQGEAKGEPLEASLKYVDGVISADYHMSDPFYAATNYPRPELIIYHVARLLMAFPNCDLKVHRPKLKTQLVQLIKNELPPLNGLIAANALLMLGESPKHQPEENDVIRDDRGYFFHAGMMSAFENGLSQSLSKNALFHLRYRCEALNVAMLVERLLLQRKMDSNQ